MSATAADVVGDVEYEEVDPHADPARAQAISNRVMAGEDVLEPGDQVPLVEEPPEDVVTLPGGFVDRQGVLYRTVRVRELTGEDEEELARPSSRRTPTHLIDTLVTRCVTHVGSLVVGKDLPTKELGKLLAGDRDMIALAIARVTYGQKIELPVGCPRCGEGFTVSYDLLKDVPIRELPGDPNKVQRECDLPAGGTGKKRRAEGKALVHLIDGDTQLAVLEADVHNDMNVAQRNSLILRECVDEYRGRPVYSIDEVRKWPTLDRDAIVKFLTETNCGPRYEEVSQDCPNCRATFPLVIGPEILFQ